MKKLFLLLTISLIVCTTVNASTLETESHVEDMVEASMEILKTGTINDFIDRLRPIWSKPEAEIDAVKNRLTTSESRRTSGLGQHSMSNLLT